jgi:TFIIF-interacting CTD phosphatase-like protein
MVVESSDIDQIKSTFQAQSNVRKIINNASITIEVTGIQTAIESIKSIADRSGGYVEHLSSHSNQAHPQANLTIRIPQPKFNSTLQNLKSLGEVKNHSSGTEDVSEQFVDLAARLKSLAAEEASLLSLLDRVEGISDILSIERELYRVRLDIERYQGQLHFLKSKIDLSTIYITLFIPYEPLPEPPSAFLVVENPKVSKRVQEIKDFANNKGVLIDKITASKRNGQESSTISMRLYPKDFINAINFLQDLGEVTSKDVNEEIIPEQSTLTSILNRDSLITITITTPDKSSIRLFAIIGILLLGVFTAGTLWVAFYKTYQAGRNKSDRFIQDKTI